MKFTMCIYIEITKKIKMDRKRKFDQLMTKRFEKIRERVKVKAIKRKAQRKSKPALNAQNHGNYF